MSEREKLARLLLGGDDVWDNAPHMHADMLAEADRVLAAGYRLVATEGPEFEAMVVKLRAGIEMRKGVKEALRAALETGERDG